MKPVKILHIGDMQRGFTREDGNLYVPGAQDIIEPANGFLRAVQTGVFDYTLVIMDTHFTEEYHLSQESVQFPPHCEFGTADWELSVDISGCFPVLYLLKNQFTMWGENQGDVSLFTEPTRIQAHQNLFHVIDNLTSPKQVIPRDDFIKAMGDSSDGVMLEVTMIGVASDFCIRYALEGWLARGARVTIISDLTKGINKETPEVLGECQYHKYGHDRLRTLSALEYLNEIGMPVKKD